MHFLPDQAPTAHAAPVVPVKLPTFLGWTDPETGDELGIAMHGSGEFLSQLLALGFSDLRSEPASTSVDGAGAGDWMGEARAGANPD